MYKRNQTAPVHFVLVDTTSETPVTSGTPVINLTKAVYDKDTGLIGHTTTATATNAGVHHGDGVWSVELTATELDADWIGVVITETGSHPFFVEIETTAIPNISDVAVPASRTIVLQQTSLGLTGEASETIQVGESKIYAVDFRKDMATNGRFGSIVSVAIQSGSSGGITFDSADNAADRTAIKIKPTAVTAGTYVIKVQVTYASGEEAEGDVTLVVVD